MSNISDVINDSVEKNDRKKLVELGNSFQHCMLSIGQDCVYANRCHMIKDNIKILKNIRAKNGTINSYLNEMIDILERYKEDE